MKKLLCMLLCLFASHSLQADPTMDAKKESVILREPELSTFASLVEIAKLQDFFQGTGPFTGFIPTNSAFEKVDPKKLDSLREEAHRDELIDLINYHVILGSYLSQNLKAGSIRTVNGKDITIRIEGDQIWVNDAKVVKKDLIGPNGVCFTIDTVLIPMEST